MARTIHSANGDTRKFGGRRDFLKLAALGSAATAMAPWSNGAGRAEAQAAEVSHGLETHIILKAWEDSGFKNALLDNPRAAIEAELGVDLPPQLQVDVLEEGPNHMILVIPSSSSDVLDETYGGALAQTWLDAATPSLELEAGITVADTRLVLKAWSDEGFKSSLLENPRETIEAELGMELPAELQVDALEATSESLVVVLPPNPRDTFDATYDSMVGQEWSNPDGLVAALSRRVADRPEACQATCPNSCSCLAFTVWMTREWID